MDLIVWEDWQGGVPMREGEEESGEEPFPRGKRRERLSEGWERTIAMEEYHQTEAVDNLTMLTHDPWRDEGRAINTLISLLDTASVFAGISHWANSPAVRVHQSPPVWFIHVDFLIEQLEQGAEWISRHISNWSLQICTVSILKKNYLCSLSAISLYYPVALISFQERLLESTHWHCFLFFFFFFFVLFFFLILFYF